MVNPNQTLDFKSISLYYFINCIEEAAVFLKQSIPSLLSSPCVPALLYVNQSKCLFIKIREPNITMSLTRSL